MVSIHTKEKIKFFFRQKRAQIGCFIFLGLLFFSMTADFWSNDKPLLLIKQEDHGSTFFFPIVKNYDPSEFGITDSFYIDYKKIAFENKKIRAFFPLNRWDPFDQSADVLAKPSKKHWLGTDNLGRDILARLFYGVRISLGFALILWVFSYVFGTVIGAMQGYFLGLFDFILERMKELETLIPVLTVVVLVTAISKNQSFWIILFLVLIFAWMGIASQIRATVLSLRNSGFCEAATALGGSHIHLISKHILPNSMTPVITLSPFAIEAGISILAALDYLGFGLSPPTPSLGELMAQGRDNLQNAPWVLISPVVTILLLLISVSLIGQALRDAFDPKIA